MLTRPLAIALVFFSISSFASIELFVAGKKGDEAVVGDEVTVKLTNLKPDSTARLTATMGGWKSWANFKVGPAGEVDLSKQAPLDGSYHGVDPDGMFWSMAKKRALRPKSSNVTFALDHGDTAQLTRRLVDKTVHVEEVRRDGLVARFFTPGGAGKFPAVLVLGGSEGGLESPSYFAGLIASQGYAALALAYFAEEGLPEKLDNIPIEYFEKAMRWLAPRSSRIAVLGTSRGGELALLLGSLFPEIKAVVANVPSALTWGDDAASWTYHGVPFPFVPGSEQDVVSKVLSSGEVVWFYRPCFVKAMERHPDLVEKSTIHVENTRAPILFLAGEDDQIWPSCPFAKMALDRLKASGHAFADESYCFPGAGHDLGSPGYPTTTRHYVDALSKQLIAIGGEPETAARAQRNSWTKIKAFLAKHFR